MMLSATALVASSYAQLVSELCSASASLRDSVRSPVMTPWTFAIFWSFF
jgi:hypothetical protein